MKVIHLKGFTDEERLSYKDIIHSNVIMAMRSIITASDKLGVNNIKPENKVSEGEGTNRSVYGPISLVVRTLVYPCVFFFVTGICRNVYHK